MTQTLLPSDELVFGDMNGPLVYWGPVTASPAATFTAAEKVLLRQLRARLAPTQAAALNEAGATLLAEPRVAA